MGWRKDKFDGRDFLHVVAVAPVPSVFINTGLATVRDQGQIGACVGFGVGANLTREAQLQKLSAEWMSPEWIYNGARYIEGTLAQDAGCEPGDALNWLRKRGALQEHFWPYDPVTLDTTAPSTTREAEVINATVYYYRVVNGTAGICSALAFGHCVSIGTPWFERWMSAPKGVLKAVTTKGSVVGGHETYLYGYDLNKKIFYGRNSWGTGWGNAGGYIMPFSAFDVFKSLGGYDAYYVLLSAAHPRTTPATPPTVSG